MSVLLIRQRRRTIARGDIRTIEWTITLPPTHIMRVYYFARSAFIDDLSISVRPLCANNSTRNGIRRGDVRGSDEWWTTTSILRPAFKGQVFAAGSSHIRNRFRLQQTIKYMRAPWSGCVQGLTNLGFSWVSLLGLVQTMSLATQVVSFRRRRFGWHEKMNILGHAWSQCAFDSGTHRLFCGYLPYYCRICSSFTTMSETPGSLHCRKVVESPIHDDGSKQT